MGSEPDLAQDLHRRIRLGYKSWEGAFYPEGVPRSRQLAYVGRRFNSVEVNGTFYSLQRPDTFRKWAAATPRSFRFALKRSCPGTWRKRRGWHPATTGAWRAGPGRRHPAPGELDCGLWAQEDEGGEGYGDAQGVQSRERHHQVADAVT